jgi:hypothetical protein
VNTTDIAPTANLLARVTAVYAAFENLLIAELVAGNAIAGTPMAACGRVALGMVCTLARLLTSPTPACSLEALARPLAESR